MHQPRRDYGLFDAGVGADREFPKSLRVAQGRAGGEEY